MTAAASGGVTHGPTISADSAPMTATPVSEPPDCVLLTFAIFGLPRTRQLQFVEAEHRQRQQHEQAGETPQHPRRRLERGLQVLAGQAGDHAGER